MDHGDPAHHAMLDRSECRDQFGSGEQEDDARVLGTHVTDLKFLQLVRS